MLPLLECNVLFSWPATYAEHVKNHQSLLPLNDYFTMLSLLVFSSQCRGREKEREFTFALRLAKTFEF